MYWNTEPGGISTTDKWKFNKFSDSLNVADNTSSWRDPKLFYWFYLFFFSTVFSCCATTLPATSYPYHNCCQSGWSFRTLANSVRLTSLYGTQDRKGIVIGCLFHMRGTLSTYSQVSPVSHSSVFLSICYLKGLWKNTTSKAFDCLKNNVSELLCNSCTNNWSIKLQKQYDLLTSKQKAFLGLSKAGVLF